MSIYTAYVTYDQLLSPVTGYTCRRITKQNIHRFGFSSIEELHSSYPGFPTTCESYHQKITTGALDARLEGIRRKQQEHVEEKKLREDESVKDYQRSPSICAVCGAHIPVSNRHSSFCSRSCANTRKHKPETIEKLRRASTKPAKKRICKYCSVEFTHPKRRLSCSDECLRKARRSGNDRSALEQYRADCAFKFDVEDYPEEFDLSLVSDLGWYSPANRGNNLTGVSKDHMVSVKYGFENDIDPKLLSHPANCALLPHSKNSSKGEGCSLTEASLLERIARWEAKYGPPS